MHAVDCGERHTAVLLTSGAVYTAGSNEYGACGIADDFAEVSGPLNRHVTCTHSLIMRQVSVLTKNNQFRAAQNVH